MIRVLSLLVIISLYSCARQTSPNGGPKDLIAPQLTRSDPQNNQKNFQEKVLTFDFTEPVKLKDPKEEIIITPQAGKEISYLAKKNTITLENKAGWKDSTTYSIAFRDAVQDITESNPVENLKIAFSTGSVIDSMELKGTVTDALTEKIPQKMTVAIFQSDTFQIFKHAPVYFTKTDKEGKFVITNLKPGSYKIYAFDDKNKNLKVESKTEALGFFPGKVTLPDTTDTLVIRTLTMDARPLHLTNLRHTDKSSTLKFNKELLTYSSTYQAPHMPNAFGDDHSEITFYHLTELTDSIPLAIHGIDSLAQTIDTLVYLKTGGNAGFSAPFKYEPHQTIINRENNIFSTNITLTKPILSLNLDSIFIQIDSAHHINFTATDINYDTAHNQFSLKKEIEKKLLDTLTQPLFLFIGTAAFVSMENDSSKTNLTIIPSPKLDETATLIIEVNTTKTDFEVQLLTDTYKIVKSARNLRNITFRNIPPAEYKIRVYIDTNKNNKWDPGNVYLDIPPEPTYYYKNATGKYQFPLRANWEVGPYVLTF